MEMSVMPGRYYRFPVDHVPVTAAVRVRVSFPVPNVRVIVRNETETVRGWSSAKRKL